MEVLVRLQDAVTAQQFVDFLRAEGVACTIAGGLLDSAGPFAGVFKGQYSVLLLDRADTARARELQSEYFESPPELDALWEDESEPDLSLLDPALLPRCPSCRYQLLSLPGKDACPACHAPMDLVALIVAEHGPDALVGCYGASMAPARDAAGQEAWDLPCPVCRYSLRGLSPRGLCPECGRAYDKAKF